MEDLSKLNLVEDILPVYKALVFSLNQTMLFGQLQNEAQIWFFW